MVFRKSGSTSVCVAIGPGVITAVQARKKNDRMEVLNYGAVEAPVQVSDGAFIQNPARIGQAIRQLWRQMGLKERTAILVCPSESYSMRALRFPDVPERERRTIVRGELEQSGGIPPGDGSFDAIWLGTGMEASGVQQSDVYAFFASDTLVENARFALRAGGVRLTSIVPRSQSLMQAYLATATHSDPVALICPSERHTDLCMHDGRGVRHLRRIPVGWIDLKRREQAIQPDGTSLSAEGGRQNPDVESRWSWETGPDFEETPAPFAWDAPDRPRQPASDTWSRPSEPRQPPAPTVLPDEATGLGEPSFLATEVARSVAFYTREHEVSVHPQKLVIVASREVSRHFETDLAGALSISVVRADPLSDLQFPAAGTSAETSPTGRDCYLSCVGALAAELGIQTGLPALDLARQDAETRMRAQRSASQARGAIGGAAWLGVSVLLAIGLSVFELHSQGESRLLQAEIQKIEDDRAPQLRLHQIAMEVREAEAKVRAPVSSILGRVAAATNPSIQINELAVGTDGRVRVSGEAMDTSSLQRFARDLGQGASIRLPVIDSMRQGENGRLIFQISGVYRSSETPPESGKNG